MDKQDPVNKAKESAAKVLDEALTYFGRATDTGVEMQREFFKMQREFFKTWTSRWRGSNGGQSPVSSEDLKKLQSSWSDTIDHMLAKRREVFEIQYRSAVDAVEGAVRLAQSANPGNPEELGERIEVFCRSSLAAWQKSSEAQLQEIQEAAKALVEMSTASFAGTAA